MHERYLNHLFRVLHSKSIPGVPQHISDVLRFPSLDPNPPWTEFGACNGLVVRQGYEHEIVFTLTPARDARLDTDFINNLHELCFMWIKPGAIIHPSGYSYIGMSGIIFRGMRIVEINSKTQDFYNKKPSIMFEAKQKVGYATYELERLDGKEDGCFRRAVAF